MFLRPETKQIDFDDLDNSCYFYVVDVTDELNENFVENIQGSFDNLVVKSVSEKHMESADIVNVLADTYVTYTAGAKPVQVNISCMLRHTREKDHYLKFLEYYHNKIRGTELSKNRLIVYFIYIDQYMCLRINNLSVRKDSSLDDMVSVNIQAVGFRFGNFKGIIEQEQVEEEELEVTDLTLERETIEPTHAKLYDDDVELVRHA